MFKRYTILILAIVLIFYILSQFTLADSTIPPELQDEADKAGINTEGLTILEIKTKISETLKNGAANNPVNADTKTDGDNANQSQSVKADKMSDVANQAEINPEIQDRAQKAGIDTTGLTNQDIKIKLQEAWNAGFREKAKNYGIDTTNLSDEQVREQVLTIENADAIAKAKRGGINTDGLTYSQVMAAIEEADMARARNEYGINTDGLTYGQVIAAMQERIREMIMVNARNKFGINTDGLTYDQVIAAIQEVVQEQMAKMKEESVNNGNSNNNEQPMKDLIITAKALGIEYEGLSYEELYEKVIAAKKASIKNN